MAALSDFILSFFAVYQCFIGLHEVFGCDEEPSVNYIADNLLINYTVIENNYNNTVNYLGQINFTNTGTQAIRSGSWRIYFTHTRMIVNARPNGTMLGNSGLVVHHHNGVLYWIEPTSSFSDLQPSRTLSVLFVGVDWMVTRTDSMPNWYVVSNGTDCNDTHVILSTMGESLNYVSPFVIPQQWKRLKTDNYDPYTPQKRYEEDNVADRGAPVRKILPTPLYAQYQDAKINLLLDNFVVIIPEDPSIYNEARILADKFRLNLIPSSVAPSKNALYLQIDNERNVMNKSGAYEIQINVTHIVITGFDSSGVFYGVQSLFSLADTTVEGEVPIAVIRDSPRFEYRGLHVDVSRNFHTVDDLQRLMSVMALYKLNRLHIHLGDDEGWRLDIPSIPELTQVGSRRCHDLSGNMCLMPQLGSIPTLPNLGSGYYSIDDYKSILAYAKERYIIVIPEFDMPGHSHASINSMLARHRKFISTNATKAKEYLLTDLTDNSVYRSVQDFTDNAINPCVNSTYNFIETVMREVQAMHRDIQPLVLYHIGGDEVAIGAWINSPMCQMQFGVNVTQSQVKRYFLQRINEIVTQLNLTPVGWEDGFILDGMIHNRTELFSGDVWATTWDNVWEWGTGGRAYGFANADYKVVLNHATHLFIDFPAEPDPEERGYYWATRTIPLRKTFSYMPDDVYGNMDMDVDRMGHPIDRTSICSPIGSCPPLENGSVTNIVGMQAQTWGETIRTSDHLDYMIFPRLLAVAERAWHKADWESIDTINERKTKLSEDYEAFANTLGYKELRRLDNFGIKYRIPLVGARKSNSSTAQVTSGLPGLEIQYRALKQDSQWNTLSGYSLTMKINSTVEFRTRSADGKRYSRTVSVLFEVPTVPVSRAFYHSSESWLIVFCLTILIGQKFV